jgi:hypothetical protein
MESYRKNIRRIFQILLQTISEDQAVRSKD